jgi:hypothetical protein
MRRLVVETSWRDLQNMCDQNDACIMHDAKQNSKCMLMMNMTLSGAQKDGGRNHPKIWWEESLKKRVGARGITQREGGGNHSKRGWEESLKKRVGGITLACEAHRVSLRHRELGRLSRLIWPFLASNCTQATALPQPEAKETAQGSCSLTHQEKADCFNDYQRFIEHV